MSLAIVLYHSPRCIHCQRIQARGGGWSLMRQHPWLQDRVPFELVNVDELAEHPPYLQDRGVPQIHLVRQATPAGPGQSLFSQLGNFSEGRVGPVLDGFVEAVEAAKAGEVANGGARPARRRALMRRR